jgi:hypothetical protein
MTLLQSAAEHYRRQQRLTAAAVVAARRQRGRSAALVGVVSQFQYAAARDSAQAVADMLEEQGSISAPVAVIPGALAGIASDGRSLESLMGYGVAQQLPQRWFDLVVATQVQDAARTAAGVEIASRPEVNGYIRMMNPPSCSRCAVLAGKWFRWNQGFQRHPRCDCRHIPAAEAGDYSDVRLSGDKWFHTLSPTEQDRAFTKAGAQAIRDGADLTQVVNARRGMETIGQSQTRINADGFTVNVTRRSMAPTTIGRGEVYITREGVTRRGVAYRSLSPDPQTDRRDAGARYRRAARPRLMPESIYRIAGNNRAEAIRLLRGNGYIL